MTSPTRRVVPVDGIPMSGLFAPADDPQAVIIALHGGASSAAYFDCPGHPDLSFVRAAAAAGFSAIALDRPGYGASAPYSDAMWDPQRRAELAYGAADAMLGKRQRGAGVFILAHSNGCELALRMAAADGEQPLLGLELAGTGLRQYPAARAILNQATPTHRPAGLRELIWAPEELYPADVINAVGSAGTPPQEAEISAHWANRDFPALAGQVTAPLRFTAAEHERVWDSTPEALADIAALFVKSPQVEIHHQSGAGHNLSLSLAAAQYHSTILSFAEHCITADVNREAG